MKTDLLKPQIGSLDLRANVTIKAGAAAEEIRALCAKWQMEPSSVIRLLAIQGLTKGV